MPFLEVDYDELYRVAPDPWIWEQHPNKDWWKRALFQVFYRRSTQ